MNKKKLTILISCTVLILIIVISSLILLFSNNSILSFGESDEGSPNDISEYEGENVQLTADGKVKKVDDEILDEAKKVSEEMKKIEDDLLKEKGKLKDTSSSMSSSTGYTETVAVDTNNISKTEVANIQKEIDRLEKESQKNVTPSDSKYDIDFTVELPKGDYILPPYTKYNDTVIGKFLLNYTNDDKSKIQNVQYHTTSNGKKPNKERAKVFLKDSEIEVTEYLTSEKDAYDYQTSFLINTPTLTSGVYDLKSELVLTYYKIIQDYMKLSDKEMEEVKSHLNTVLTGKDTYDVADDESYEVIKSINGGVRIGWWR